MPPRLRKQQYEDLAVFRRVGGGGAPVLAGTDMGVIPGLHALGAQPFVQQLHRGSIRASVADEDLPARL